MLEWAVAMTVLLALASSVMFLLRVQAGEQIGVSAHWGGLGGGTSGWRFSPPLVLLLAAFFFWICAGAFALYRSEATRSDAAASASAARSDALASASAQREKSVFEREERHRKEDRDERDQRTREGLAAASAKPVAPAVSATASVQRAAVRTPAPPPVPSS